MGWGGMSNYSEEGVRNRTPTGDHIQKCPHAYRRTGICTCAAPPAAGRRTLHLVAVTLRLNRERAEKFLSTSGSSDKSCRRLWSKERYSKLCNRWRLAVYNALFTDTVWVHKDEM